VTTTPLIVTAAVIERGGHFFMTRRLKDTHLAGIWEFPGGKCDADESLTECLERELLEELGTRATIGREIFTVEHAYPERTVRLHFFTTSLVDEPRPLLGQEMRWVSREELRTLQLPEADRGLVELLVSAIDSGPDPTPR
jgi:mutator protein MutT